MGNAVVTTSVIGKPIPHVIPNGAPVLSCLASSQSDQVVWSDRRAGKRSDTCIYDTQVQVGIPLIVANDGRLENKHLGHHP